MFELKGRGEEDCVLRKRCQGDMLFAITCWTPVSNSPVHFYKSLSACILANAVGLVNCIRHLLSASHHVLAAQLCHTTLLRCLRLPRGEIPTILRAHVRCSLAPVLALACGFAVMCVCSGCFMCMLRETSLAFTARMPADEHACHCRWDNTEWLSW